MRRYKDETHNSPPTAVMMISTLFPSDLVLTEKSKMKTIKERREHDASKRDSAVEDLITNLYFAARAGWAAAEHKED
jgi:hypothetical protein